MQPNETTEIPKTIHSTTNGRLVKLVSELLAEEATGKSSTLSMSTKLIEIKKLSEVATYEELDAAHDLVRQAIAAEIPAT